MSNKYLHVGPGGTKCPCCFPLKRSKARKGEFKKAKLRERRASAKEQKHNG